MVLSGELQRRAALGSQCWDAACQWRGLGLPSLPGWVWVQWQVSEEAAHLLLWGLASHAVGIHRKKRAVKLVKHSWHPGPWDNRGYTGLWFIIRSTELLQDLNTLLCYLLLRVRWCHAKACPKGLSTQIFEAFTCQRQENLTKWPDLRAEPGQPVRQT